MKKILTLFLVITVLFVISGCSSESEPTLSMEDFINAFTAQGVEVDPDEKPYFQMVGAEDGVIFYYDLSPVSIYEYKSTKDLNNAKKEFSVISDFLANRNFIIESNNADAINIFNNVN